MEGSSDKYISTGLKNLDKLLQTEGVPKGTVGIMRTSPTASTYRFFERYVRKHGDKALWLTNQIDTDIIEHRLDAIHDLESNPQLVDIDFSQAKDLIKTVENEVADSEVDGVIINTGNVFFDGANADGEFFDSLGTHRQLVNELRSLAREHDIVININLVMEVDSVPQRFHEAHQQADFVFSLVKDRSEQSIRQRFLFEKFPYGVGLNEAQYDSPVVEIEFISESLSVDSGERI